MSKFDRIKPAFDKLEPSDGLCMRVHGLVDSADLTAVPKRMPRLPKRMKALIALAAAMALTILTVSAYGVIKLLYLPGAGLVDESGILVISENNIGDVEGITAYTTPSALDFGDYVIDSVTYVEYSADVAKSGGSSYAVWTHMDESLLDESRGSEGIPIADRVIADLSLTLPDGTVLLPESTRYSYSGSIVYTYSGDFSTEFTISSASLNESVNVKLARIEGAGYKYMEYPTENGISLMIYPINSDFSEYELSYIDNHTSGELAKYVKEESIAMYDMKPYSFSNGDETYGIKVWRSRIHTPDGNYSTGGGDYSDGSAINSRKSEYGYYHWLKINKPAGTAVTGVSVNGIDLHYHMNYRDDDLSVELAIPSDGERINGDFVIFDKAGFDVRITGYERHGNKLTIYFPENAEMYIEPFLYSVGFDSEQYDSASAHLSFYNLRTADNDGPWASGYTGGGVEYNDNGELCATYKISAGTGVEFDLGEYDYITLTLSDLVCAVGGEWNITY